ncbi:MAG: flagellar biosynthesis repressor FlbT [Aestuariivirga sp.]|uniref:flagellar biosynthesis repressor FlbT n=1 Tax=Aestuariivirga sp. TaxID=2650926 RepID=UPI0038CF6805
MFIHLKRGEKLYVNGAVLRVDRRTSLEFLNDVTFLLENHVMQAEEATTPVKQLYFVVQTMLMDPANAGMTAELYKHLSFRVQQDTGDEAVKSAIDIADKKVSDGRYFDALKHLRSCFSPAKRPENANTHAEEAA